MSSQSAQKMSCTAALKHEKSIEKTNSAGTSDTRETFINDSIQQKICHDTCSSFCIN